MSGLRQDLEISALMGAGKSSGQPDWPRSLRPLIDGLPTREPARALLAQLAISTVWQRAGQQSSAHPAFAPAPAEDRLRPLPPAARALLHELLAAPEPDTLPEWLEHMRQRGFHPDARNLTALLRRGEQRREWRRAIGAVAGRRGEWLAGLQEDWRWLTGATLPTDSAPETVSAFWQDAAAPGRELFLIRWREADPAAARGWLQSLWPQEAANARAQWLELCRHGLGPDDAPWLENLLDDRSKQVRDAALGLLARLPDSPWRQRMQRRCGDALRLHRGLLRSTLEITLPETLPADGARDGLDPRAHDQQGLGEKAQWLRLVIAGAGGDWLLHHTGLKPDALVAALTKTDWAQAVLLGLTEAAVNTGCQPLLLALLAQAKRGHPENRLLDALPESARESCLLERFSHDSKAGADTAVLLTGLTPWAWSEEFTRRVLNVMRTLEEPQHLQSRYGANARLQRLLAVQGDPAVLNSQDPTRLPGELASDWRARLRFLQALDTA